MIMVKALSRAGNSSTVKVCVSLKDEARARFESEAAGALTAFLKDRSAALAFPQFDTPLVSVILVLFNRAELTFQCLTSIEQHADSPYEIIIVDNGSRDRTAAMLNRLENVKIWNHRKNHGFSKACNKAADMSVGRYLLFLV